MVATALKARPPQPENSSHGVVWEVLLQPNSLLAIKIVVRVTIPTIAMATRTNRRVVVEVAGPPTSKAVKALHRSLTATSLPKALVINSSRDKDRARTLSPTDPKLPATSDLMQFNLLLIPVPIILLCLSLSTLTPQTTTSLIHTLIYELIFRRGLNIFENYLLTFDSKF